MMAKSWYWKTGRMSVSLRPPPFSFAQWTEGILTLSTLAQTVYQCQLWIDILENIWKLFLNICMWNEKEFLINENQILKNPVSLRWFKGTSEFYYLFPHLGSPPDVIYSDIFIISLFIKIMYASILCILAQWHLRKCKRVVHLPKKPKGSPASHCDKRTQTWACHARERNMQLCLSLCAENI